MNTKSYSLLFITAVLIVCLFGWTGYAQNQNASANSKVIWEYKILKGERDLTEDTLNDMGMYGWELIMFDDGERGNGSYKGTYYFKRRK